MLSPSLCGTGGEGKSPPVPPQGSLIRPCLLALPPGQGRCAALASRGLGINPSAPPPLNEAGKSLKPRLVLSRASSLLLRKEVLEFGAQLLELLRLQILDGETDLALAGEHFHRPLAIAVNDFNSSRLGALARPL